MIINLDEEQEQGLDEPSVSNSELGGTYEESGESSSSFVLLDGQCRPERFKMDSRENHPKLQLPPT